MTKKVNIKYTKQVNKIKTLILQNTVKFKNNFKKRERREKILAS